MKYLYILSLSLLSVSGCSFDTAGLSSSNTETCGNHTLDEGEACDGVIIPESCTDRGFTGGITGCSSCTIDVSACTDFCGECDTGSSRCLDNTMFQCVNDGTGCGMWQPGEDCGAGGEYCQELPEGAFCEATCVNQCAEGETRCAPDFGAIESCGTVVADGTLCTLWQTSTGCGDEQACRPIDGAPTCVQQCLSECTQGEEICSEDFLARLVCVADQTGCLRWEESPCPTENRCVEKAENDAECSCSICTEGELRCSTSGDTIERCTPFGTECTRWELFDTCNLDQYEFCSEGSGSPICTIMGDTCDSVFPIHTIPYQIQLSEFTSNFSDSITLNDPSCGGTLANSNDIAYSVEMEAGESIQVIKMSGMDVTIRVVATCSEQSTCLTYGDNQITFTAMEAGTYIFVIEKRGSGSGDLNIGFTTGSALCTDGESEPNNSALESNPYPGPHEVWCSSIATPTDTDCVAIEVGADGYIFEAFTSDIYDPNQCSGDTYLQLFDSSGALVASADDGGAEGICSRLSPISRPALIDPAPGTYHLCVSQGPHDAAIPAVATHLNLITTPQWYLNEAFSSCPLAGWQSIAVSGNTTWECTSGTSTRMSVTLTETGVAELHTPNFDVSQVSSLILDMMHQHSGLTGVIQGTISIAAEGSDPFVVWSASDNQTNMEHLTLDLSSNISGLSVIKLIFRFESTAFMSSGSWQIDDVRVVGF